jgi:predicted nucleotidyltransferase
MFTLIVIFLDALEQYFRTGVDVLGYRCIHPVLRDDILKSEVRLYDEQ